VYHNDDNERCALEWPKNIVKHIWLITNCIVFKVGMNSIHAIHWTTKRWHAMHQQIWWTSMSQSHIVAELQQPESHLQLFCWQQCVAQWTGPPQWRPTEVFVDLSVWFVLLSRPDQRTSLFLSNFVLVKSMIERLWKVWKLQWNAPFKCFFQLLVWMGLCLSHLMMFLACWSLLCPLSALW